MLKLDLPATLHIISFYSICNRFTLTLTGYLYAFSLHFLQHSQPVLSQQHIMNRCLSSRDPRAPILAARYRNSIAVSTQGDPSPDTIPLTRTSSTILPSSQCPIRESCSEMQKAVANEAMKSLESQSLIIPLVFQLIHAANEFQKALGEKGEVHCFLTTHDFKSVNKSTNLFPLVSSLYHAAFLTSNQGSTIAAQAIRDAFHIVRKVAYVQFHNKKRYDSPSPKPQMQLPTWFPWSVTPKTNAESQSAKSIMCDVQITQRLGRLGSKPICEIYGQLFTHLWNIGREKN